MDGRGTKESSDGEVMTPRVSGWGGVRWMELVKGLVLTGFGLGLRHPGMRRFNILGREGSPSYWGRVGPVLGAVWTGLAFQKDPAAPHPTGLHLGGHWASPITGC